MLACQRLRSDLKRHHSGDRIELAKYSSNQKSAGNDQRPLWDRNREEFSSAFYGQPIIAD